MSLNTRILRVLVPATVASLVLAGCSTAQSSTESSPAPAMSESGAAPATDDSDMPAESMPAAAGPGRYVTLADYQASAGSERPGEVVLFFHADWCPTCQATEADLTENAGAIPAGLTIVKVDYDDSDDLKRKYGVTTQHTFVHIAADGSELGKWTGSETSADIAANLA